MSDPAEKLTLVCLRRLDANMVELRADMSDVKHRLTALEIQFGQFAATEMNHYASIVTRLDRVDHTLDRLERQADIVPA